MQTVFASCSFMAFFYDNWSCRGATMVVLTNFTVVTYLQAYHKNSSNERSTPFFNFTLLLFGEYFLIISEFQITVKFVKTTIVGAVVAPLHESRY